MSSQRQLAAILFTDIEGYTSLMQANEHRAVAVMKHYDEALERRVTEFGGKVMNNYGDGSLCTFPSAVQALQGALALQKDLQTEPRVPLRIGIHIGEIFFERDKIMGDGVNVASRIQSLGKPNMVLFSREVFDKIKNHPEFKAQSVGSFHFKNVKEPMEIFALANEGLEVPKARHLEGKLQKKSSRTRNRALWAALSILLLLGAFLGWKFISQKYFTELDKSIAVLPFANLSGDKSQDFKSDGFTDDLILRLYKISGLKVISRTSAMTYKNKTLDAPEIAEALHVAFLLEGSMEKTGDRYHVKAKLVDGSNGQLVWGEEYDESADRYFDIQTQISQEVGNRVRAKLTEEEKNRIRQRPTQNLEAYDQYNQGRFFWNQKNDSALIKAIGFFTRATELDPNYAQAYAGLADCYSARGYGSYISPSEAFLTAEKYAEKALQLDPTLAEPHTSLGYIYFYYRWDWEKADQEFQKAITLNPQYDYAFDAYAYFLTAMERFAEARAQLDRALELSPLSAAWTADMGFSLFYKKQYDEAIRPLQRSLQFSKANVLGHIWLGRVYQAEKKYPEALDQYKQTLTINHGWPVALAAIGNVYGTLGQKDSALAIINQMKTLSNTRYVTPYGIALVYTAMGDRANAIQYLEKAFVDRAHWLVWLKQDPRWEPLHEDPAYQEMVGRMKFPQSTAMP